MWLSDSPITWVVASRLQQKSMTSATTEYNPQSRRNPRHSGPKFVYFKGGMGIGTHPQFPSLPDKRACIWRRSPKLRVLSAPLQWFRNPDKEPTHICRQEQYKGLVIDRGFPGRISYTYIGSHVLFLIKYYSLFVTQIYTNADLIFLQLGNNNCSVIHQSCLQSNTFSKLSYIFLTNKNVPQIMPFQLRFHTKTMNT